jgi:hypothetical protein
MTAIVYGDQAEAAVTRRGLLAAGAATLAAVALTDAARLASVATRLGPAGPGAGIAAGGATNGAPAHFRRSTFTGLIGERFVLTAAGARATGRLIAVDGLRRGADRALVRNEDAFALVFQTDGRPLLPDEIMTVAHAGLGAFELFVSRSSAGRHGQEYTAIINRASPTPSGDSRVRTVPR